MKKQVSPICLENVLLTHPAIADAGVIGLPDLRAGELPAAFVVLKAAMPATEAEIKAFVDGKCLWKVFNFSKPSEPKNKIFFRV